MAIYKPLLIVACWFQQFTIRVIIDSLHNKTVAEVQQLDWATKWSNTGLLGIEDKNNNGRIELTPDKASSEITIDRLPKEMAHFLGI